MERRPKCIIKCTVSPRHFRGRCPLRLSRKVEGSPNREAEENFGEDREKPRASNARVSVRTPLSPS